MLATYAVQVVAVGQVVQVAPLVVAGQPASQPSVGLLLVSKVLVSQEEREVHPLATAVVQMAQMPLVATQPASQPSAALPFVSNLLASQDDIAVHPLAIAVVQVAQRPLVATHPASQPSDGLLLVLNVLDTQVTAVHPLTSAEVQAVHVPWGTEAQSIQAALLPWVAYSPESQTLH
jgi:hypothetical protein